MVLAVGECLRRGYDDTLAGMDAEWVKIFHVADGDAIVVLVAHHLVFYFFPSFKAFFHEHLRGEGEGFFCEFVEFLFVVAESRTESSESISGTKYDWIAKRGSGSPCLLDGFAGFAFYSLYVNLVEFFNEEFTIFGIHDGLDGSTEHFYPVFLKHSGEVEFHTTVECGLSAKGEEYTVGAFLCYHFLNEVWLHWKEVYLVGYTL